MIKHVQRKRNGWKKLQFSVKKVLQLGFALFPLSFFLSPFLSLSFSFSLFLSLTLTGSYEFTLARLRKKLLEVDLLPMECCLKARAAQDKKLKSLFLIKMVFAFLRRN